MCGGASLVALNVFPGCGGNSSNTEATCSAASIGVGDAESLAVGQARYIPSPGLFVCRDDGGYYAMDAACTHIGTDIEFQSAQVGFRCPLHGATYDFDGHVLTGPAMRDLPHYSLCTTPSGLLIVDTGAQVTPDTRLIV